MRWYSYRWLIERYHYVLKSGCGIEKLQLETAERLEMALATYSIVAQCVCFILLIWLAARLMPVVKLCYHIENSRLFMQQFITKVILILPRQL